MTLNWSFYPLEGHRLGRLGVLVTGLRLRRTENKTMDPGENRGRKPTPPFEPH